MYELEGNTYTDRVQIETDECMTLFLIVLEHIAEKHLHYLSERKGRKREKL